MKKLFMLFAVIGLLGGCGESEPVDPVDPWEPVSIVGQWKQVMVERYAPDGMLLEQLRLDADEQDIVIFDEAGFYRYFDFPDWVEYEGTYAYDRFVRHLGMETFDLRYTSVHATYNTAVGDDFYGMMRWVYQADKSGSWKVEYYVPSEQQLPAPPEKEEDMAVYFPDEIFRNYMTLNFDTDGDRRISVSEAARITELIFRNTPVTSLAGIEYCTALTYLDCREDQLTTLDVSHNTALKYLYCYFNQLTVLDVSRNTQLETLHCYYNQLTALDVSQNAALKYLWCSNNQLTTLDVGHNTVLQELYCFDNQLTALDVSHNTVLQELHCSDNQLTTLDVSQNTALEMLICCRNQLTTLDVSRNTALTNLHCYGNQLTTLDVSNCKQLKLLGLNPMPSLQTLYMATGQKIPNMDIPETTQIIYK